MIPPWNESIEAMLMILPPALRDHDPCRRLREEKGSLQVDVQHIVPIRFAEIKCRGAADDAGIVDQDIEASHLRDDSGNDLVKSLHTGRRRRSHTTCW